MVPAGQRLRDKLFATSGMRLFKLHESDEQGRAAGMNIIESEVEHILHSTCWATRNFRITIATVDKLNKTKQPDTSDKDTACIDYILEQNSIKRLLHTKQSNLNARNYGLLSSSLLFGNHNPFLHNESGCIVGLHKEKTYSMVNDVVGTDEAMQSAAQKVQCCYRRYKARMQYLFVRDKIIKLQASFRRMRVRKQYNQLCAATQLAQKYWRISTARRLLRSLRFEWTLKHQAAILIQANIRGWFVRRQGRRWHIAETSSRQHEQRYVDLRKVEAARKIQAAIRLFLFRRSFHAYRRARSEHIISPSQTFHNNASNRSGDSEASEKFIDTASACIVIQRYIRGYKTRKAIRSWQNAARVIQHYWRQVYFDKLVHCNLHNKGNMLDGDAHDSRTVISTSRGLGAVDLHVKDFCDSECSRNGKIGISSEPSKHIIDKVKETIPSGSFIAAASTGVHNHFHEPLLGMQVQHNCDMLTFLHSAPIAHDCSCNIVEKLVSPGFRHKLSRLKQNQEKLQKFAQIFLLHHHIAAQQQRAQFAPPFPPQHAPVYSVTGFVSNSCKVGEGTLQDGARYVKETEGVQKVPLPKETTLRSGKEVALDVIALLKTLEQTQKTASASMSKANVENVALLSDTEMIMPNDCIVCPQNSELLFGNQYSAFRGTGQIGIKRVGLPNLSTLLAVVVALVIYTKTLCHGIFFGSTQRQ